MGSCLGPRRGDRGADVGEVRGDGELAAYDVEVALARRPHPGDHRRGRQVDDGGAGLAQHDGVAGVEADGGGDLAGGGERVHVPMAS